jgi:hypothetical protein
MLIIFILSVDRATNWQYSLQRIFVSSAVIWGSIMMGVAE